MSSRPNVQNYSLVILERSLRITCFWVRRPYLQVLRDRWSKKEGRSPLTCPIPSELSSWWGLSIRQHQKCTQLSNRSSSVGWVAGGSSTHVALGVSAKGRKERNLPTKMELSTGPHIHLNEVFLATSGPRTVSPKEWGCLQVPVLVTDFSMVLSKTS